jgi:hypothetical protein
MFLLSANEGFGFLHISVQARLKFCGQLGVVHLNGQFEIVQ